MVTEWLIASIGTDMKIPLQLRLPPDAKAFIEAEARENASSQNSEIVRAIRARMKAKGPAEVAASPSLHSSNP